VETYGDLDTLVSEDESRVGEGEFGRHADHRWKSVVGEVER